MYLDFTSEFDTLQSHPSLPPSVTATQWSCLFSPQCGTAPAFPSTLQFEVKGVNPHQTFSDAQPIASFWTGMPACQNIAFQGREHRRTPKMLGLLP